jgi:small subunit ribosomal protein S35
MANAGQCFRFTARRCRYRIATQARTTRSFDRRRQFTTSVSRLVDQADEDIDVEVLRANLPSVEATLAQLASKPVERTKELDEGLAKLIQEHGRHVMRGVPEELRRAPPFKEMRVEKPKPGLLNMGATPADEPEEDPEFQEDDISSLAHGELEQHREFRHYARLAAWEMPLLTSTNLCLKTSTSH